MYALHHCIGTFIFVLVNLIKARSLTVSDQQPVYLRTCGGNQRWTICDYRLQMNLFPFEIRSNTALRRLCRPVKVRNSLVGP